MHLTSSEHTYLSLKAKTFHNKRVQMSLTINKYHNSADYCMLCVCVYTYAMQYHRQHLHDCNNQNICWAATLISPVIAVTIAI